MYQTLGSLSLPKRISLYVLGKWWRWWRWLWWLLMVNTLLGLSRLVDRRHALWIIKLQVREGIQFLRQASGIRRIRERAGQQFRETTTSERSL